jgi:pimeloyl-ACP methyl ester carboxylesterase
VERLDHPDGSRSWLVAVPGTQSWAFDDDVATDMGTNLQLVGGLADPMTAGVLAAMAAAVVAPDEPVVLAGHSQGGMVAMAAAAAVAGTYRVGGVVTAGSPSVPGRTPAGVPVVRIEHDEDVVPQTDGEPTVAGGDVTRVTRSLADGHPMLVTEAHAVTGYVETARLADGQVAASPGAAPGVAAVAGLLGGEGTTATTFQYRVERAGR